MTNPIFKKLSKHKIEVKKLNNTQNKEIVLRRNDKTIIEILLVQDKELGLQRDEISKISKIARTTVFDSLTRLERINIVDSDIRSIARNNIGRRGTFWSLTNHYLHNIEMELLKWRN